MARAVRFMLYKNFEKPDVPVKRQEIVEVLQVGYNAWSTSAQQQSTLPTSLMELQACL